MKNDKREIILNSAEELMLSGSCDKLSMNMIAANAGIAKGGIYYYFESKEEVLYAVIQRAYKKAIHEYLACADAEISGTEKLKTLFTVITGKKFRDEQTNLLIALHINENTVIHNYIKLIAIEELSPVLEKILIQCRNEGSISMEVETGEVSEMIIAVLTFLLDGTIFDSNNSNKKIRLFSRVLDTCLCAEPGTFGFLCERGK